MSHHHQHNRIAHDIVQSIANDTADRICNIEDCDLSIAEEMLGRSYIEAVGGFMDGASWFLQGEAETGSEILLTKICGSFLKAPSERRRITTAPRLRACGRQLSYYSKSYFPRYLDILSQVFTERLRSAELEKIRHINLDGIVKLAVADLPNADEEVRREARRRGLICSGNFVPLSHLARRRSIMPANLPRLT